MTRSTRTTSKVRRIKRRYKKTKRKKKKRQKRKSIKRVDKIKHRRVINMHAGTGTRFNKNAHLICPSDNYIVSSGGQEVNRLSLEENNDIKTWNTGEFPFTSCFCQTGGGDPVVLPTHCDYRRNIYKVVFPGKNTFCLKFTGRKSYIRKYEQEVQIYEYFKSTKKDGEASPDIVEFHEAGYASIKDGHGTMGTAVIKFKDKNTGPIEIDGMRAMSEGIKPYWMLLEWPAEFVTPKDLWKNPQLKVKWGKCFTAVCDSLGKLNKKYGFCHGDFKVDNVLVKPGSGPLEVKHFDFDCSFFVCGIGDRTNRGILCKMLRNYILMKADMLPQEDRCFVFCFDVWRYWCSIMLGKIGGVRKSFTDFEMEGCSTTNEIHLYKDNNFTITHDMLTKACYKYHEKLAKKESQIQNLTIDDIIRIRAVEKKIPAETISWNNTICSMDFFEKHIWKYVKSKNEEVLSV